MKQERTYSLDFLKILATVAIVFHHFQQVFAVTFQKHINFFGDWFFWGYLVEFFFLLSGFFMYKYKEKILSGEGSFGSWFARRLKRLLPVVAVSAIAFEILLFCYAKVYDTRFWDLQLSLWGTVTACLGLQHSWCFVGSDINSPTWYVSVLLLCYVAFWLLTYLARRFKVSPTYFYLAMILVGCGLLSYQISLPFFNERSARGFYAFFFGLVFAGFIKEFGNKKTTWISALVVVFMLVLLFALWPSVVQFGLNYILTFLFFPAVVVLFLTKPMQKVFCHSFWGKCGSIFFNVYVWHLPLMVLYLVLSKACAWNLNLENPVFMYAFLGVTIAFATASHYLIENPLDQFFSRQIAFFERKKEKQNHE